MTSKILNNVLTILKKTRKVIYNQLTYMLICKCLGTSLESKTSCLHSSIMNTFNIKRSGDIFCIGKTESLDGPQRKKN